MAACENLTRMSEVCFDVVAVLPAGGCGTRMNMGLPKQFHLILGRPLISYTLAAFESVPWIKEIVVPISENYVKEGQQILKEFLHTKVRLTPGGTTRHRSIFSGIQALTVDGRSPPSVVILHDAVRPFVDEETLHCVTKAANKHGAAGVIRPLVSTVIAQSSDGFLDHSLDRSKYRASEMPQAFRYEIIKKAYEQCTENDLEYGTECLHLVQEYCETRPLLIDGPESLWKVTYRKDLYSLEGILREKLCHPVVVVGKDCFNFFSELSVILQRRNALVTRLEDVPKNEELLIEKVFEIKSRQLVFVGSVSLVCLIDHTKSNEKLSAGGFAPSYIERFFQGIFERSNSLRRFRLVNVEFSNKRRDLNVLQATTADMKLLVKKPAAVECFGVFVCQQCKADESRARLVSKAAELTASALFDVPSVLNGQTFDTVT